MKNRYINSTLTKIDENIKKTNNRKEIIDTLYLLGLIGGSIFVIGGLASSGALALSGLCLIGTCAINKYKNNKLAKLKTERLNNEKAHLMKIKVETPKSNTDLTKRRVRKLKALRNNKKELEESCSFSKGLNTFSTIASGVGAALTFVNPMLSILGFAGLGLNLINAHNTIAKNKSKETTTNRINNINNDLEVIKNEERDNQSSRIGTRNVMKPSSNTNQKTNQRPLPSRNTNILKQPTQIYNTQAVNNYVNNLANQNNQQKTNQKVKN